MDEVKVANLEAELGCLDQQLPDPRKLRSESLR